ncbi:ABC transporter substrate-binding protein [Iamia majanohamensis]|uniref:ABC transporter substrate-binding protein n=1 Tax=Iamia majanohamensis TaxID=467976 RepID=A0AAF0BWA1_9ACTN|nr:ABC transporter substrate-binding protein [Iamia majanohamensis]WCO67823.1 ABC transporter substrate-binding protein [Iamia majanohamensis]
MNRSKNLVALLAIAILSLAACGSADDATSSPIPGGGGDAPDGEPIIVGIDEDSTSAGAAYSQTTARALRDTIAKINEEGGILDRPVEVVTGNSESDPTKAPAVARSLIDQGAVAIFLTAGSAASIQMKPVLQDQQIISLAPTASNPDLIAQPDADYVYTVAPSSSTWPPIYCGAFETMGVERVAVLTENSSTISSLNEFIVDEGISECVDVVAVEAADTDATDVTAQATRVKDADPDAILVSSSGGSFEVLVQNTLEQVVPDVPRFTLATLANQPEEWRVANAGALEGLLALASIDITNERTQEAIDYFESVNGDDFVITGFDAQAYDAAYLLKEAIESAGTVDDPEAIQEAMNQIEDYEPHSGLSDFRISFGPDKHNGPDGICGYLLAGFTADNELGEPADVYEATC